MCRSRACQGRRMPVADWEGSMFIGMRQGTGKRAVMRLTFSVKNKSRPAKSNCLYNCKP